MSNTRLEEIKQRKDKRYGARCDGITDDTVALRATVDVSFLLQELEKLQEERDMYKRKYDAAFQRGEEMLEFIGGCVPSKKYEKLQQENERLQDAYDQWNPLGDKEALRLRQIQRVIDAHNKDKAGN